MKVGWYTHHIESDEKSRQGASTGQEMPLSGLFSGRFAGGAEMSDWEYRQCAPQGTEITLVSGETFHEHDLDKFDVILVTGTESFSDWQLQELAFYEPKVFLHHLQTPRDKLRTLINSSSLFITHTPAHMQRELAWTHPRKTAQVLSYFDTSIFDQFKDLEKHPQAVWAGRNHPLKGLNQARMWAAQNDKFLMIHTNSSREAVLFDMATSTDFVHLPLAFESECRSVMEAVLAGCKVHTNDLVGITSVEDWDQPEVLKNMIDKAGDTFWRLVQM